MDKDSLSRYTSIVTPPVQLPRDLVIRLCCDYARVVKDAWFTKLEVPQLGGKLAPANIKYKLVLKHEIQGCYQPSRQIISQVIV